MVKLSAKSQKVLCVTFREEMRAAALLFLEQECADNLPLCEGYDSQQLERVRFAALKLSQGDLVKLAEAVNLAKIDWRDVLVAAGFAESVTAHEQWAKWILKS